MRPLLLQGLLCLCLHAHQASATLARPFPSPYVRPPASPDLSVEAIVASRRVADAASQVKVILGAPGFVTVSWLSSSTIPGSVAYGTSSSSLASTAKEARAPSEYSCLLYSSGQVHAATLGPLKPQTQYFYRIAGSSSVHALTSPPAASVVSGEPFSFSVVGDLGQTSDSNSTLHQMISLGSRMVVHVGDLSYADCDPPRWDSYGLLVEPLASTVPWMPLAGNHEEESMCCGQSFKSYETRYGQFLPYGPKDSFQYYSFDTAGVHFIMLGSYTNFSSSSAQIAWLKKDLASVNRSITPFVIASVHAPWYNSNKAHHDETEETEFRKSAEQIINDNSVDLFFAGHVHAYERSFPVFKEQANTTCATTYVNIGDGGNREGLADGYYDQPEWSAFREASFGHGRLTVQDAKTLVWEWHRNQDTATVVADTVSFAARPECWAKNHVA